MDRITELSILYEISTLPFHVQDLDSIVSVALEKSTRLLANDIGIFYIVDSPGIYISYSSVGIPQDFINPLKIHTLSPDDDDNIFNNEIRGYKKKDMDDLMLNLIKDPYKPENAVILPLRTEDGLTAILYLARLNETEYTEVDMHFFQVLANRLSIDLENYFLWKKKDRALKQLEEERNKLEVLNKELSRKNREIECINERLKMSSRTDPLTGIYNRRVLFEYLEDAVEKNRLEIDRTKMMKKRGSNILPVRRKNDKGQFQNYYKQFSVALIDIDYFKYINDFHGHLAGDDVLRTIGVLLKDESILRLSDIPGRYGGEEFLIIFPDTRCYESINSLKRFYEGLNNQKFKGRNNQRFKITVSIGMSDFEPEDTEAVHVIDRADKALYHAKHNGRNRVSIHDDGTNYYELEFG